MKITPVRTVLLIASVILLAAAIWQLAYSGYFMLFFFTGAMFLIFAVMGRFYGKVLDLLKRLLNIGQPGTCITWGIILGAAAGLYFGMQVGNFAIFLTIWEATGLAFGVVGEELSNPKKKMPTGPDKVMFYISLLVLAAVMVGALVSLIFGW